MRGVLPPLALTYHGVADVPLRDDPHHFFVRPDDLRRQIAALRRWGYELVTAGGLAERVAAGRGAGCAALTFDDGFVDNLETLVPLLVETRAPATVFLVSGWLGQAHPSAPRTRVVTADEAQALAAAGVEIGAHTASHPDLTRLPRAEAETELRRGREELEAVLGASVEVVAYPFGTATAETREAARAAGFRAAFRTLGEGTWDDLFDLPRQAMENRASVLGLRLKRRGRYEPIMRRRAARGMRRLSRRARELAGL
jgi:peptidoglycan/xylan/chitin deacetylase (PgdA/CDA1 family)